MNKYFDAEKTLAERLGWTEIEFHEEFGFNPARLIGLNSASSRDRVPRWTKSWFECAPFIAEYNLKFEWMDNECRVENQWGDEVLANYAEHKSERELAVRFAIVKSVTLHLSH